MRDGGRGGRGCVREHEVRRRTGRQGDNAGRISLAHALLQVRRRLVRVKVRVRARLGLIYGGEAKRGCG